MTAVYELIRPGTLAGRQGVPTYKGDRRELCIAGLRVADASIMATVTTGNTNAPSIMIGERAADFLLARG